MLLHRPLILRSLSISRLAVELCEIKPLEIVPVAVDNAESTHRLATVSAEAGARGMLGRGASVAYLVDVNQYHLVGRTEVDLMAIVIDESSNRIDHNVPLQIAVVADRRPDGKLWSALGSRNSNPERGEGGG